MTLLNRTHILNAGIFKSGAFKVNRVVFAALILFSLIVFSAPSSWAQSAFDDPGSRKGKVTGGDLSTVDGDIDAGSVALGSSSQVVVLMRNDGGRPIAAGTISLYPSSNVSASIGENECAERSLPPEAVCAIAMSIKGLQPGKFRVEMLMRHDGRTKLVTTTVSGRIESSNDSTRDIISDLETIPSELKFGTLKESRPLTRSIILRNVTSSKISIESLEIESNDQAGYSLKTDCDELDSGAACVVTVTWAPQQRGPSTGVLVVNHNGPTGVVSVILDGKYQPGKASQVGIFPEAVPGKGLLTASQTNVSFGSGIESMSAITVSLVNVGDTPLTLKNIRLSGDDNGIRIASGGCKEGLVLNPVEACPLTLTWEPVREGSILDDVQIHHDGARGILVLPVTGAATKAVNKDSQAIVFGSDASSLLRSIPPISESEVSGSSSSKKEGSGRKKAVASSVSGALDGYKITSLAKRRAIVSGPGGSRVVLDGEETVIGGVLWRVGVHFSAVEFKSGAQKVLILFDRSLSSSSSSGSKSKARSKAKSSSSSSSSSGKGDS